MFPPPRWTGSVTGIVEAWGEVDLHPDGFRAQFARPRWLVLPARADRETTRALAALAAKYDAEVLTLRNAGELMGHCRDHDLGMAPAAVGELLGTAALNATPGVVAPVGVTASGSRRRGGAVGLLRTLASGALAVLGLVFQGAGALLAVAYLLLIWGGFALAVFQAFGGGGGR